MAVKINRVDSRMIRETRSAVHVPPIWASALIFLAIFVCAQIVQSIFVAVPMFMVLFQKILASVDFNPSSYAEIMDITAEVLTYPSVFLTMLYTTVFCIIATFIVCRKMIKRSWASIGFVRKGWFKDYLLGALYGALMLVAVYAFSALFGEGFDIKFNGFNWIIILFMFGFVIQSASEEILLRGYLMPAIAARKNIVWAVMANSVLFGLLHILNPGVSFLSIVNIILIGIAFSLMAVISDNIWVVCGMHFSWNFMISNILGGYVSGMNTVTSLFTITVKGTNVITGGNFGPEGSILDTVITILICVALWIIASRRALPVSPYLSPIVDAMSPQHSFDAQVNAANRPQAPANQHGGYYPGASGETMDLINDESTAGPEQSGE